MDKCTALNPFQKVAQSQQFEYYISMFELVVDDDIAPLKEEFQQYMLDTPPENPEIEILEYWKTAARNYPHLSKAALSLLCVCIGSVDAERSFSKLRTVQELHRCSMSEETLRMQMTLILIRI